MAPSAHQAPPSRPSQSSNSRARMTLFSTIRYSIYGTVILFTVICLAMAGHFQSVLAASDLSEKFGWHWYIIIPLTPIHFIAARFVPFAIFVCSASMLIFVVLSTFSFFLRGRNPISTKIELACLGLAGMFWLVLGVYLTTSDAQSADVECFSSDNSSEVLDDASASFHTDQYQAMYRVLNAFSLMNAALVLFALFTLLFLAIRRHRKGDEHMWHGPVTSCAWFNNYENAKQTRGKTSSSSILPVASAYMGEPVYTEKPERKASGKRDRERDYATTTYTRPYQSRNPYPTPPPKTNMPVRHPTRQDSGRVPRNAGTVANLENGGMLNPYSNRTRVSPR